MIKLDFDSTKNREQALANFESLLKHPGWSLVEAIAFQNIDVIKNQIIDGIGEGETVETINRLRDKLRAYQDVINTPSYWIEKLKPIENSTYNEDDPFTTVELEEKKKL
jgi:hypothetical protein